MPTETEGQGLAQTPAPGVPGAVLEVPLTETSPGVYETWYNLPADLAPGIYDVVGTLTVGGTLAAVTPPAVLILLTPSGAAPPAPVGAPQPTAAAPPQPAAPPPAGPGAPAPTPTPAPAPGPVTIPGRPTPSPFAPAPGGSSNLPEAPTWSAEATRSVPGGELWVTPDDMLIIGVRSSLPGVTLTLAARMWDPTGQFVGGVTNVVPPGDRSLNFYTMPLGYGYLTHAALVTPSGNVHRGQTYVQVLLARELATKFQTYACLFQGYLSSTRKLSWPPGLLEDPLDGQGYLYDFQVSTPSAGSQWNQQVPSFARWRVASIVAELDTSATVANRFPGIQWTNDHLAVIFSPMSNLTETAGNSQVYTWARRGTADVITGTLSTVGLDLPLMLRAGGGIQSQVQNMQSGDQWKNIYMSVEEWIEGN